MKRWSKEDFRTVRLLCMILHQWIHVIIHLSKPIECTTPRVKPNIKYGIWVIMMCQFRFINCTKCITLGGDADNRGDYARMGAGNIWELCTFCSVLLCT